MSELNDNKSEQIDALSIAISDIMSDSLIDSRVKDDHYIICGGNINSKILVLQMHPDNSELSWAKREDTHQKYVCSGPSGNVFKDEARKAGFDVDNDFIYANAIPFYPLGGAHYSKEAAENFTWILEAILEIIEPRIIITLGYEVFDHIVGGIDRHHFNGILKSKVSAFHFDPYVIIPLDNPEKKTSTRRLLDKLYTKTKYYLNYGSEQSTE